MRASKKNGNKNQITVYLDDEACNKIEEQKGELSTNQFLSKIIENALGV